MSTTKQITIKEIKNGLIVELNQWNEDYTEVKNESVYVASPGQIAESIQEFFN